MYSFHLDECESHDVLVKCQNFLDSKEKSDKCIGTQVVCAHGHLQRLFLVFVYLKPFDVLTIQSYAIPVLTHKFQYI